MSQPEIPAGLPDAEILDVDISVGTRKGLVFIQLGKNTPWFAIPPEQARTVANIIIEKTDLLDGKDR